MKILVATTRERADATGNIFTNNRARELNYAAFTLAVPPSQTSGQEPPRIAVVEQAALTKASFQDRVTSGRRRNEKREVVVFVHGFNNNFQEALFRFGQMAADAGAPAIPILFAWPSEGRATAYMADRDAVAHSRTYLADVLTALAANPRVERVTVLAHSMGAWLTNESLRELRTAGKNNVFKRLRVVLAAPDIDVEVFRQQVEAIGPLSPPMEVLVASDDRALTWSRRLMGGGTRVGALDVGDPRVQAAVTQARIRVVDISELSPGRFNHDRFIQLAALYHQLAAADTGTAGTFVLNPRAQTGGDLFTAANR